ATGVMVVGEGLLSAARFALRVVACGNAFSLRSNRTLVEASHPSRTERYEKKKKKKNNKKKKKKKKKKE
ncbi:hypothetical protein K798_00620, partial [Salmonella enterica subsp. enterica serovar Newport str. SHSN007]